MVKWRSLLAGGVVSAVCIWLLLRSVDLGKVGETLSRADPFWIGVTLVIIFAAVLLRCWRWQLLFLPHDRISFWGAFSSTMIGYMFNTVLPGRVGELARAALVSQTERVGTGRALGTILVEKILDVLVLLLLLGILIPSLPPLPAVQIGDATVRIDPRAIGAGAAVIFGSVAVAFFLMSQMRGPVVQWVERHLDNAPVIGRLKPSALVEMVLGSADSLRQPRLLALLTNIAIARAFGLDVPWTGPALVLALTNLGMTIPSAPGYVGVYHIIATAAMTPFGVSSDAAAAYAIGAHALAFGSFLLVGALVLLLGLARQHYTMADLWRWRTSPAGPHPGPQPVPLPQESATPNPAQRSAIREGSEISSTPSDQAPLSSRERGRG